MRNLRGETTLNGTSKGRWKKWIKMKQKSEVKKMKAGARKGLK